MLPAILAASAAVEVYGKLKSGSAQRRAADNRATALAGQARKRLAQGKQQSELIDAQGGAAKTSALAAGLGAGRSEYSTSISSSLDEITNRAKYEADQAMSTAQEEANAILSDSRDISQEGRYAQEAAAYSTTGTLLNAGAGYLEGKYGKDAYSKVFGTNYTK